MPAWHKFNAVRTNGHASKLEAALYNLLKLREMAQELTELKTQVQVYLTRARIIYKPDFSYYEGGILTYAESKGFETPEWRIKRRLWKCYGPGKLLVYKGSYKRLYLHETIIPEGGDGHEGKC